ncbi:MAG: hypothetical protein ABSA70_12015 [Terriglobia bacterium]
MCSRVLGVKSQGGLEFFKRRIHVRFLTEDGAENVMCFLVIGLGANGGAPPGSRE